VTGNGGDGGAGRACRCFSGGSLPVHEENDPGLEPTSGPSCKYRHCATPSSGFGHPVSWSRRSPTWMPTSMSASSTSKQGSANLAFGSLVILAGIPGTLIGGVIADRWVTRIVGARVVIPGVGLSTAGALFHGVVHPHAPFAGAFSLQLFAFLISSSTIPALRAGLADAVPGTAARTGYGALQTWPRSSSGLRWRRSRQRRWRRTSGATTGSPSPWLCRSRSSGRPACLAARPHIERDTAKIFEAVVARAGRVRGTGRADLSNP